MTGWPTHSVFFPKAKSAHNNTRIFQYMTQNGADLHQARRIDWTMYFPSEQRAREARTRLVAPYSVDVQASDGDSGEWKVVASLTTILTFELAARMEARMEAFAKGLGGSYDGWGAEIQDVR